MEIRERRLAQIVRDFLEAYECAARVGEALRLGTLEFSAVEQFVGEAEDSALFRLKEECHALFRLETDEELRAEELFDLAVGALFHEGMKFREGFYVTTRYGPRLHLMMTEGSASGALALAVQKVVEDGRRRMIESHEELEVLLRETRDQLLVVLGHVGASGAIARCLLEDPARTERVFDHPLRALLETIYGSAEAGFVSALESLFQSAHHGSAADLMEHPAAQWCGFAVKLRSCARGLALYYDGDRTGALDAFAEWIEQGSPGPAHWRERARSVLLRIGDGVEGRDGRADRVLALLEKLSSSPPA